MKRRWIALALCLALACADALAQYPSKPIRLIVPFPPGGPTDIVGRLTAQKLTDALGQAVLVDNRSGASGTLGAETAAKSPPDGYTLFFGTTGTLASAPSLFPSLSYDPVRSFAPISRLTNAVFLVVVNATVPVNSLRELIDYAKARPGQLAFGSGGSGHPLHIAGEMFKVAAGVDLVHVPYKGTGPALTDLVAGRTHVMFEQLPALHPHIRTGKLKPLAVAGPDRMAQLADVPTSAQAGLPGYEVSAWFGLLAPAGTPRDIIVRLNVETRKALSTREIQQAFAKHGIDAVASSPEEFGALIVAEAAKWSQAVKLSGARLD